MQVTTLTRVSESVDHGLSPEVIAELEQHAMLDVQVDEVFTNFAYDTSMTTPNRTPDSSTPTSITLHWWGSPSLHRNGVGLGVARYLSQASAQASAQYVACVPATGEKIVYQLASDTDDAWHAGNWVGNHNSIAIEAMPIDSLTPAWQVDAMLDLLAELVASLWHRWPHLTGQALIPHQQWTQTTCPGTYMSYLGEIVSRAQAKHPLYAGEFGRFYDQPNNKQEEDDMAYVISCPGRGIAFAAPGYFYGIPTADHVHAAVKLARQQVLETQDPAEWDRWRNILTGGISSPVDLSRVLEAIGQAGGQAGISDEAIQRICDAVTKVSAEDVARRLEVTPKGVAA